MAKTPEKSATENTVKEYKGPIIPFTKVENNISLSTTERLNGFIQNNRRTIAIVSISVVVLLAGFITGLSIKDTLQSKAIGQMERFKERYEELRADLNESSKETEVTALVDELSAFASKQTGDVGGRAYAILGNIYADKKDWAAAEKAWTQGAQTAVKTYLVPVSLCNAAVAAEEQGNVQGAIDLYTQSVALGDLFPGASRAQFQIGRLEETRNNKDAAIQAYQELVTKWPHDTIWVNLAQSKIIGLKVR
jgi:cytochrome c-type biogenesis protein CcmH/NrfG